MPETFDLSRLGAWSELPFFGQPLERIAAGLDGPFLPPPVLTFRALECTQPQDVRAVILGQDPYHTPGKADGLAFSIPDAFGGRLDSLGNILKELESDLGVARRRTSLQDWADGGVLLLNTALTVPPHAPKAHAKLGWSALVSEVLAHLSDRPRAFLLWGAPAQAYSNQLDTRHLVLRSPHPSPLSAHRGFFGSRPFSKVNQWLIDQGERPIDWAGA
ncbi:uracil-DNA glycosylase [Yoonia sediminilitoris]|uniref:Uracil-DNA glycosylase n=1 Tax=Yoonia sediminilitoris TaxID=1286148 RepID=A0A2T6KRX0_9RHOB|nr:uracil-DNA glycosylase [Yoonia sediminilitoris]PUB19297.1 uracil-DNA glycosylase [Yoonia sediminilitoris]RCW99465.1 uracil-DNA glycosylase [Yoonia sediminilitoris]